MFKQTTSLNLQASLPITRSQEAVPSSYPVRLAYQSNNNKDSRLSGKISLSGKNIQNESPDANA